MGALYVSRRCYWRRGGPLDHRLRLRCRCVHICKGIVVVGNRVTWELTAGGVLPRLSETLINNVTIRASPICNGFTPKFLLDLHLYYIVLHLYFLLHFSTERVSSVCTGTCGRALSKFRVSLSRKLQFIYHQSESTIQHGTKIKNQKSTIDTLYNSLLV